MTNQWAIHDERKHGAALWWICNRNEANSGEHKTKRSLTTRLGALRPSMCRGCLSSLRPATVLRRTSSTSYDPRRKRRSTAGRPPWRRYRLHRLA